MKRILLVDDHAMARQPLKLFLEHHGYACHEAEHGAAALAWLDAGHQVDLIISDNHMPVMTGMEFLIQVKANGQYASIPFMLYSGNITDVAATTGLSDWSYGRAEQTAQTFRFRCDRRQGSRNTVKRGS